MKRSIQPHSSRSETTNGSPRRWRTARSTHSVWPLTTSNGSPSRRAASAGSVATIVMPARARPRARRSGAPRRAAPRARRGCRPAPASRRAGSARSAAASAACAPCAPRRTRPTATRGRGGRRRRRRRSRAGRPCARRCGARPRRGSSRPTGARRPRSFRIDGISAERRRAVQLAAPAQAQAGERDAGDRRQQRALAQPGEHRAVLVEHVRPEVRAVRPVEAARTAARRRARVEEHDRGAGLRERDRRGHARDARSDDRDGLHARNRTAKLDRDTVPVVSSISVPVAHRPRRPELPLHEQLERQLREAIQAGRLGARHRAAVEPWPRRPRSASPAASSARPTASSPRRATWTCARARRCASRRRSSASARASRPARCSRASPTTCAPGRTCRVPARRVAALACAPPGATRRSTPSASPTRAACRRCARRWPSSSPARAARPPTPSTCSSARASAPASPRSAAGWREQGADAVAVEDPGWHPARLVIEQAGLRVRPVPVDEHGLRVDALGDAQVVVVTPAHQFPTGVALSPERRAALVEWAADGRAADRRGRLRRRARRAAGAGARARGADRLAEPSGSLPGCGSAGC